MMNLFWKTKRNDLQENLQVFLGKTLEVKSGPLCLRKKKSKMRGTMKGLLEFSGRLRGVPGPAFCNSDGFEMDC